MTYSFSFWWIFSSRTIERYNLQTSPTGGPASIFVSKTFLQHNRRAVTIAEECPTHGIIQGLTSYGFRFCHEGLWLCIWWGNLILSSLAPLECLIVVTCIFFLHIDYIYLLYLWHFPFFTVKIVLLSSDFNRSFENWWKARLYMSNLNSVICLFK